MRYTVINFGAGLTELVSPSRLVKRRDFAVPDRRCMLREGLFGGPVHKEDAVVE